MIAAAGLARRFGGRPAVRDVSVSVQPGEVVGLLGPNGAGKTTTIRMLLGLLPPDAGTVEVAGPVGYVPESLAAYDALAVRSHLRFLGHLAGLRGARLGEAVDEVLERTDLTDLARRPVARLSKGQRQRTGLAGALLAKPPTLVLDEPTQGLDPRQATDFRAVVREEAERGAAVLVSTHLLSEASAVCDRVVIVDQGAVAYDGVPGSPAELEERFLEAVHRRPAPQDR